MTKRDDLIDEDGEVRELGDAFFSRAKRGRPPMLPGERKVRMNLMIDADVARGLQDVGNKSAFVSAAVRKALAG
jgi:hypothetical protein